MSVSKYGKTYDESDGSEQRFLGTNEPRPGAQRGGERSDGSIHGEARMSPPRATASALPRRRRGFLVQELWRPQPPGIP